MILKGFCSLVTSFFMTMWGVTLFSRVFDNNIVATAWASVEPGPRAVVQIAGAVYLTLKAHNYYHETKITRAQKRLQLKIELEKYEKSQTG